MIQKFLSNMEFSGVSLRQARLFMSMALREPDMKDITIEPGDNVVASFKYDPEKEELGLTDIRVSHAAQEVRGSRVEHRTPGIYFVSLPGSDEPIALRDATFEQKGNKLSITGIDKFGNKVTYSGLLDAKDPGDGQSVDTAFLMTSGWKMNVVDSGGQMDFEGGIGKNAAFTSILNRSTKRATNIIDHVENDADAESLAARFSRELPIVDAKKGTEFYSNLNAQIGAKILADAGIGLTHRDTIHNSTDLVNATAYSILRSDNLSSTEKAKYLKELQGIVLSMGEKAVASDIQPEKGEVNLKDAVTAQVGDVTDGSFYTAGAAVLAARVAMGTSLADKLPGWITGRRGGPSVEPIQTGKSGPTLNERLGMPESKQEGRIGRGLRRIAETAEVVAELGSRATVQAGGLAAGMTAAGFAMIEGARNIDNNPQKVGQMSRMAQGIMALAGVHGGPDYGETPENERIYSWKEVPGAVWDGLKEAYGFGEQTGDKAGEETGTLKSQTVDQGKGDW